MLSGKKVVKCILFLWKGIKSSHPKHNKYRMHVRTEAVFLWKS